MADIPMGVRNVRLKCNLKKNQFSSANATSCGTFCVHDLQKNQTSPKSSLSPSDFGQESNTRFGTVWYFRVEYDEYLIVCGVDGSSTAVYTNSPLLSNTSVATVGPSFVAVSRDGANDRELARARVVVVWWWWWWRCDYGCVSIVTLIAEVRATAFHDAFHKSAAFDR